MSIRRSFGACATISVGMILIGLAVVSGSASLRASEATDILLNKARSLEGRGRIDLASQALEQVLMTDPNNPEALAGLARYAKQSGKTKEAGQYLERLRKVDPDNAAITQIDEMSSLAQMRPRLDEAQRLVAKHDFEGAMRIYRQVFGSHPPAGGWALAYYETLAATPGGWQDAVAGLEALVNKYPESQDYRLALGRLWTYRQSTRTKGLELLASIKNDSGLVSKARTAWRQALVWDTGSAESLPSLREYLSRYPETELTEILERASKTPTPAPSSDARPSQEVHVPAGSVEEGAGYRALKAGRLDEAEKEFSAAIRIAPNDPKALSGLGFVRMKQQDFAAASPLFEKALSADPRNQSISEALQSARFWKQMKDGTTSLDRNQLDDAVSNFKAALSMRPQSSDALRGLAGTYMKRGEPALAAPFYERLVQAEPQNSDNWSGLISAEDASGHASDAVREFQAAPKQVAGKLATDQAFLAELALAEADAGNASEARRLFQKAEQAAGGTEMSVGTQLRFAGLFLRSGRFLQAADAFERISNAHPTNIDAWAGLINALVQVPDAMRAFSDLQRMPKDIYNVAVSDSGFLSAVASLHVLMHRYDLAQAFLEKAISIDTAGGAATVASRELQLADVLTRASKVNEAEKILRQIVDEHPDTANAWMALISLLHAAKRDDAALAEVQRMPPAVAAGLDQNGGFIAVQSGVYSSTGRAGEALALVRSTMTRLETDRQPIPADLQIQLAWLLLSQNGSERELYAVLVRDSSRTDLTAAQRDEINQIWSVWCQRRAQAAIRSGDLPRAIGILQSALRLLPADVRIQADLAGALLRNGQFRQAYDIYHDWDLRGGNPDDFSGAIGAAMTLHEDDYATRWMRRALQKYPRDSKLLTLAGKLCIQRGDYKRASAYFKAAKLSLPAEELPYGLLDPAADQATPAAATRQPTDEQRALGALLLDDASGSEAAGSIGVPPAAAEYDIVRAAPAAGAGAEPPITQVSQKASAVLGPFDEDLFAGPSPRSRQNSTRSVDPLDGQSGPDLPAGANAVMPADLDSGSRDGLPGIPDPPGSASVKAAFVQPSLSDEIDHDLEAVEARNTPFVDTGASVQGRSGQAGYDKLLIEQANLEASATLGDAVRLSLVAHPTYLDAGTPNGSSTLPFGSQVQGRPSGVQTASGISAEGQLATRMFGLRVGMGPDGFLVRNWVGGIRVTPAGGPITLLFNRDDVRDTMLSFAGERDAVTNRVWGGVVANTFSLLGNWGNEKSGLYANAGYQLIRGLDVADNARFDASIGEYFRVYSGKAGSVTLGMNLTGMHYDKNLRYFTFGQGGYFSPQQYFLFSVPVQWTGWWRQKLQYSVSATIGAQHFSENASPYFPVQSSSTDSGLLYPAYANTGANYNLDARTGYQIAPHWLAEAFLNLNNARNYVASSAGMSLKYLFEARPLSPDLNIISVPNWKGSQPFALSPAN
ncbi:MAG: BCSC C-terminal domain-containing protein [Acidobacteriaceae bacterium]|nr:BCSC C-terminal domain-containing protein [Acidobacteriaceae bacterium]